MILLLVSSLGFSVSVTAVSHSSSDFSLNFYPLIGDNETFTDENISLTFLVSPISNGITPSSFYVAYYLDGKYYGEAYSSRLDYLSDSPEGGVTIYHGMELEIFFNELTQGEHKLEINGTLSVIYADGSSPELITLNPFIANFYVNLPTEQPANTTTDEQNAKSNLFYSRSAMILLEIIGVAVLVSFALLIIYKKSKVQKKINSVALG
jgi:hypothetical protein